MRFLRHTIAIPFVSLLVASACGGGGGGGGGGSGTGGGPTVEEKEWTVTVTPATLSAGQATITVKNLGSSAHDLTVVKTDKAPDSLSNDGSRVTEQSIGATAAINPGQSATLPLNLAAGKYVFLCNQPGHYGLGMRTAVTVQ